MTRCRTTQKFILLAIVFTCLLGNGRADAGGAPYIGMQPQELPQKAIDALGLSSKGVVAIRDVGRGTPAEQAGVRRGDIMLTLNGEQIETLDQVIAIVTKASPGDVFGLTVLRNGEKVDLSLTSIPWPESRKIKKNFVGQIPALGLTTAALSTKIREQFGVRWDSEGVVVTLVDPSKGVSEIIKRGDVIVQFNQQPVWLPAQLISAYEAAKGSGKATALLLLERPDGYVFILLPVR
ncbi:MAG: PDZ domain-containing protein [Rhodospirillales bacterium]|nr:PDZ domain-containing protein [Rhodospirillales bacterium]